MSDLALSTPPAGLILTPGASADRDDATLVALEQALPEITIERLTLATTSVPNAVKKIVAAADDLAPPRLPRVLVEVGPHRRWRQPHDPGLRDIGEDRAPRSPEVDLDAFGLERLAAHAAFLGPYGTWQE